MCCWKFIHPLCLQKAETTDSRHTAVDLQPPDPRGFSNKYSGLIRSNYPLRQQKTDQADYLYGRDCVCLALGRFSHLSPLVGGERPRCARPAEQ